MDPGDDASPSCTCNDGNGEGMVKILVMLPSEIGVFLDFQSLMAVSLTNLACCQAYWENDNVWKTLVQTGFVLFPNQKGLADNEDEDINPKRPPQELMPWRQLALTIQNILDGQYRVAILDTRKGRFPGPLLDHLDDNSDESSDEYSMSEHSEGDNDDQEEDSDMDFGDELFESTDASERDDLVAPEAQDTPSELINVNGFNLQPGNLLRPNSYCFNRPHYDWARMLYRHYKNNNLCMGTEVDDPEPWTYEIHPDPDLGLSSAHYPLSDSNGVLVFPCYRQSDNSSDAVVIDLSDRDRVAGRFSNGLSQQWQMGEDMVVDMDYAFSSHGRCGIKCYYDLLGETIKTASLDLGEKDDGYVDAVCACGDYALIRRKSPENNTSSSGSFGSVPRIWLVHLERSSGTLHVVYQSDCMETELKWLLSTAATAAVSDTGMGCRVGQCIIPPRESNDNYDHLFINYMGMMVIGRVLFISIQLHYSCSGLAFNSTTVVVDMKKDKVLYGICLKHRNITLREAPMMMGSKFRGGVLAIKHQPTVSPHYTLGLMTHQPPVSPHYTLGLMFAPRLPRMNSTHCKLFRLYAAAYNVKENPFHRHPKTRLPLHELVGERKLCESSDQGFLFQLHFDALVHMKNEQFQCMVPPDRQIPAPQLIFLNEQGEIYGTEEDWFHCDG